MVGYWMMVKEGDVTWVMMMIGELASTNEGRLEKLAAFVSSSH